jgi:RNA polymerase sigma-70 factor (ECF subfamily)
MGGVTRQFPATEWTWLLRGDRQEAILAELYQKYWKPIYCYLRSMGFGNEHAKDLVQGFFTDKVLGQELARKADREKGRFRSFLLRAVHNYAVSVKRGDKALQSLHPDQEDPRLVDAPEAEFNRAWADQLLHEVLNELEQECRQRDKLKHWRLFQEWILEPEIEATRAMSEVCLKHGVADVSIAYHMIENVKRRFRALLRDRLSALAASEQDIEAEIREFIEVFSGRPARK